MWTPNVKLNQGCSRSAAIPLQVFCIYVSRVAWSTVLRSASFLLLTNRLGAAAKQPVTFCALETVVSHWANWLKNLLLIVPESYSSFMEEEKRREGWGRDGGEGNCSFFPSHWSDLTFQSLLCFLTSKYLIRSYVGVTFLGSIFVPRELALCFVIMNFLGSSHYACSLSVCPKKKLYHILWAVNPDPPHVTSLCLFSSIFQRHRHPGTAQGCGITTFLLKSSARSHIYTHAYLAKKMRGRGMRMNTFYTDGWALHDSSFHGRRKLLGAPTF